MLGPEPDFVTVSKMTQVLNVFNVFVKSHAKRELSAQEKLVKSQVMALAVGLDDSYMNKAVYEE